ncbi:hypothetical protein CC86DRAFT_2958 [Ophiobolus disseminans]|uniref:Uncharacterized protein n=1 Tax=Ophiobolus disseminans TaxID=1469910 RepID=A0A6A7AIN8_9PLEO|nr:hypothetical protein CC86DRAFT_2958 [Ophiobolus disseminans]
MKCEGLFARVLSSSRMLLPCGASSEVIKLDCWPTFQTFGEHDSFQTPCHALLCSLFLRFTNVMWHEMAIAGDHSDACTSPNRTNQYKRIAKSTRHMQVHLRTRLSRPRAIWHSASCGTEVRQIKLAELAEIRVNPLFQNLQGFANHHPLRKCHTNTVLSCQTTSPQHVKVPTFFGQVGGVG